MRKRLRIAFIDHDLRNFHADTFRELIRGPLAERGAEVAVCWANEGGSGRAWAREHGVTWIDDPALIGRHADAVAVLAPSNPETHLGLCQLALPLGLPTFVDKTFAPDLATARAIFDLADRHGAPIQSSSALRYTAARAAAGEVGALRVVEASGGGRSFAEYAIHPLELAVSLLGHEALTLARAGTPEQSRLTIGFSRGRSATVDVRVGDHPFVARLVGDLGERRVVVDGGRLFRGAVDALLDFLMRGVPAVDRRETLAIRAILDAAEDPACRSGVVPLAGAEPVGRDALSRR
jgi:predicted dehydrogenase